MPDWEVLGTVAGVVVAVDRCSGCGYSSKVVARAACREHPGVWNQRALIVVHGGPGSVK